AREPPSPAGLPTRHVEERSYAAPGGAAGAAPPGRVLYWSAIVEVNEPLVVLPSRRLLPQEIVFAPATPVLFLTISVLDARSVPLPARPHMLWLATQPSRLRSAIAYSA